MSDTIPNCIPCLEGREWEYVRASLDENAVSAAGRFIGAFEREVAAFTGAAHAVAVSSGTAALHVALRIAGVGPEDEVLVPSLTFIATASAVTYCGAHPVFMDVEPGSLGMDPVKTAEFLERECRIEAGRLVNGRTGRRIAALLPVHLYGHPADLDPLVEIAGRYGLPVVEDGSEALGATYRGRSVGSLHEICCFSFNGNKIITTGGGGMILTPSAEVAARARYLSTQARNHPSEYVHEEIGYNYRLPGLNAAFGLAQAEQLPEFLRRKRRIQASYESLFAELPGMRMFGQAPWAESSFWMPILKLDREVYPEGARPFLDFLNAGGVGARPVWQPLHRQRPFEGGTAYRIEAADAIHRASVCLPCSCSITDEEIRAVAESVLKYARQVVA